MPVYGHETLRNHLGLRPKVKSAKQSLVEDQATRHNHHQPREQDHQARVLSQETPFQQDPGSLNQKVEHHRAEERPARDGDGEKLGRKCLPPSGA